MITALVEALAQAPGVAPTPGRIVHYCFETADGKKIRPAIVVEVRDGLVELCVFFAVEDKGVDRVGQMRGVKQSCMAKDGKPVSSEVSDENFIPGTWRWPPRV